jgi:uncharacterized UBP type Zn finger protein
VNQAPRCVHLVDVVVDGDRLGPAPRSDGCAACVRIGSDWLHLRRCLTCGEVGCCDGSPNRHARGHAGEHGHPLVQSFEPGEDWLHCYPEDVTFVDRLHRNSPSHP